MKKATLWLVAMVIFGNLFSQSKDWVGKDVSLYFEKELVVKEKAQILRKFGYKNFVLNLTEDVGRFGDLKNKAKNTPFFLAPLGSIYDSLVGRKFKCVAIKYTTEPFPKWCALELLEEKTGLKVYYCYDFEFDSEFPFTVVGGIVLPDKFYCRDLDTTIDKFENEKTIRTPLLENISFTKIISGKKTSYYLSVNILSGTASSGKGVILLLNNKEKISWPLEKIDIRVDGGNFEASCFILLTTTQIEKLKKNCITDVRLYIHDWSIDVDKGKKYKDYLNCISK